MWGIMKLTQFFKRKLEGKKCLLKVLTRCQPKRKKKKGAFFIASIIFFGRNLRKRL